MKVNDKEKEIYFLQWKGFKAGTTIPVFLQADVDVFLFGFSVDSKNKPGCHVQ